MTQQRWLGRRQEPRVRRLPPARPALDPDDSGVARHVRIWRRRVETPRAVGSGRRDDVRPVERTRSGIIQATTATGPIAVAKGELPHSRPSRPQGAERNIVVTLRDWMNEKQYLHDLISSDRRYPTVNGNGPLFGSPEYSSDLMPILDPVENKATTFKMPVRDPQMPLSLGPGHAAALKPLAASPYWGDEAIWDTRANNHDSMLDRDGRVWLAATVRGPENPAFCRAGSSHPSAKLFPIDRNVRQVAVFEPKTKKYTFADTCFGTHHVQFGYDADDTLWSSGGGPVLGWLNTKMFLKTGDAAASQGWTAFVLDTNGNGKRDAYVEPNDPIDPTKDKRIVTPFYSIMPSPVDGSIWGAVMGNPGAVVRVAPGSHPPETALTEVYNVPLPGFGARGADIDGNGVVWVSLASGHLGSFDRRKCKGPLNGPKATGDHCPEGWSFHQYPGPGFEGIGENSAESSYYTWVDQHDTFGLGRNVPVSTGNLNDGLVAFAGGRMVVLRVPYPLGFYAKGLDGRIDDPNGELEGTRPVGSQRRPHALAHRGRQGHAAAGRAFPAAAESAREVATPALEPRLCSDARVTLLAARARRAEPHTKEVGHDAVYNHHRVRSARRDDDGRGLVAGPADAGAALADVGYCRRIVRFVERLRRQRRGALLLRSGPVRVRACSGPCTRTRYRRAT